MTMLPAPTLRLTRDGAIVRVIINRESKLNALDYATSTPCTASSPASALSPHDVTATG